MKLATLCTCCLVMGLLLAGCSVVTVSDDTQYRDAQGRFSESFFASIREDRTSQAWLQAQFGEPLYRDPLPGNAQVLTWQFIREQRTTGDVLVVLRYRSQDKVRHYLHVVVQNETVIKSWRDEFETVDTQRVARAMGLLPKQQPTPDLAKRPASSSMHSKASLRASTPQRQVVSGPTPTNIQGVEVAQESPTTIKPDNGPTGEAELEPETVAEVAENADHGADAPQTDALPIMADAGAVNSSRSSGQNTAVQENEEPRTPVEPRSKKDPLYEL